MVLGQNIYSLLKRLKQEYTRIFCFKTIIFFMVYLS